MRRRELLQGMGMIASMAVAPESTKKNFIVEKPVDWQALPTFVQNYLVSADSLTMLSQGIFQLQVEVQRLKEELARQKNRRAGAIV